MSTRLHPTCPLSRLLVLGLLLAPLPVRAGPTSAPAAGERLLREAQTHHEMGRFEEALRVLDRAENLPGDDALLAQVQLQRGVNLAVLGHSAQARQAFALALQRDPAVTLDPIRVKPAIVSLLRSVRAEQGGRAAAQPRQGGHAASPETTVASTATLRPGTRPFALMVSLGGATGLGSAAGGFALGQELGYHLSRSARGLALALAIGESFGSKGAGAAGTTPRVNLYQLAAKASWDLQPSSRTAFYLTPLLQLGLAYGSTAVVGASESACALGIRAGVEAKLILDDRFLLYVRPFSLDLLVGGDRLAPVLGEDPSGGLVLRLDFAVGAGVIF